MKRNLVTVATKAAAGPFSEQSLRWHIFNAEQNGLANSGALVRLGRRVYIDEDRFDDWLEAQNGRSPKTQAAAA